VSVFLEQLQLAGIRELDFVQLNDCQKKESATSGAFYWTAATVSRQRTGQELVAEHVPLPLPSFGKSTAFIILATFDEPIKYASSRGLYCQAKRPGMFSWTPKTNLGQEMPCMDVILSQRQWEKTSDPFPDMHMKMRLWTNQCAQLTPGLCDNVSDW